MSRPSKTVGNLTIYDNGSRGLSWERKYKKWDGNITTDYYGISGDDMLDYDMMELIPYDFDRVFTAEEKELFISEFNRIKRNAKHSDYYDAYDNTWKNYE